MFDGVLAYSIVREIYLLNVLVESLKDTIAPPFAESVISYIDLLYIRKLEPLPIGHRVIISHSEVLHIDLFLFAFVIDKA